MTQLHLGCEDTKSERARKGESERARNREIEREREREGVRKREKVREGERSACSRDNRAKLRRTVCTAVELRIYGAGTKPLNVGKPCSATESSHIDLCGGIRKITYAALSVWAHIVVLDKNVRAKKRVAGQYTKHR